MNNYKCTPNHCAKKCEISSSKLCYVKRRMLMMVRCDCLGSPAFETVVLDLIDSVLGKHLSSADHLINTTVIGGEIQQRLYCLNRSYNHHRTRVRRNDAADLSIAGTNTFSTSLMAVLAFLNDCFYIRVSMIVLMRWNLLFTP
jgi:hypothetical protein